MNHISNTTKTEKQTSEDFKYFMQMTTILLFIIASISALTAVAFNCLVNFISSILSL